MLKKFIFITFIFFFPILINSQTNYFTLRQLIDSALKNNYNLISNKYELNKAEYSNFTENYSTNIEVSFKNGYLYSDKKENEIYVRYNFPSPYKWHIDKEVKKAYSQYLNSVFELNKKKTIMIVKQAYYKCLYEKVKYQNLKKTFEFLQNYLILLSYHLHQTVTL